MYLLLPGGTFTFAAMVSGAELVRTVSAVRVRGEAEGRLIRHLLLDSRLLAAPADACFFAIKGPRHDGHVHIREMYEKGVRVFVVSEQVDVPGDSLVMEVLDTVTALQALAAHHRMQFSIPVVGITGSNGKTTVKEWMAQLASSLTTVVKSPRSFNSQVGVPLSVWQMQDYHRLALIEAGISTTGEMGRLAEVIQPTVGIFTHLGAAHDAGFADRREKFEEKWKLFETVEMVVYRKDEEILSAWIEEKAKQRPDLKLFGWRLSDTVNQKARGLTRLHFEVEGRSLSAELPFADEASIENALHAACALLALGFDEQTVLLGLSNLRPLAMRLEWKEGLHNARLLDDAYTNDLDGLRTAVQQLALYGGSRQERLLIVSDLPEAGVMAADTYAQAGELIRAGKFSRVWAVGTGWAEYHDHLPNDSSFYPDTEALLQHLDPTELKNSLVLVKGGRAFGFERVVQRLQKHSHATRLEIDLGAIVSNLNYYRSRLPVGHKIMAMVKAGAYGAGSFEIASTLAFHKVDYLGVAYVDEGVMLREKGVTLPIMVMNAVEEQFGLCRKHSLEPAIYSLGLMREWLADLEPDNETAIHLELNTGMNRLGFDESDIASLAELLREKPAGLHIASVFSHLAAADDGGQDAFSREQVVRYEGMAELIGQAWRRPFIRHIANTAGAVRLPEAALDMVRLGIGLYGVEIAGEGALQPVGRLKSVVSQIRTVPAGESVSYGHRWHFDEPRRIATVAIGYADGLSRRMGNGAFAMRIRGGLAPTVGNVCMDMTMVDVTHLPDVRELDEAVIFDELNRIEDMARIEGTIPYEILTRISERVRRVYVNE